MLLNQCPNIEILFFNEATREKLKDKLGGEAAEQQAKNISDTFSVFCGEFIRYISTSDNNVPPTEKHGSNEWRDWYDELSILIQFLHKGQMIGKHYYYTSVDQYENEYIPDKGELNNTVNNIKKLIEGKLYK
ncbi:MAG: hypothetical protein LBC76_11270 [Treponema sp.]|nr:hypothetical protein [Treponema sp.]